jgi:hypothetical protein
MNSATTNYRRHRFPPQVISHFVRIGRRFEILGGLVAGETILAPAR